MITERYHGFRIGGPTELDIDSWIEGSDQTFPVTALQDAELVQIAPGHRARIRSTAAR
ncbi:hypothetical protein OG225_11910 [Nocardia sp. NBC_01377]|uniref:hypothetical protein n=1 Tax=Nocardia sp. NBC_01377 TaxID=2903595 RepID=UPI00324EE01A